MTKDVALYMIVAGVPALPLRARFAPDIAERLLALTGMTPETLRGGLSDPQVLGAVLEFLCNHEADLVAAASALDIAPETLVAAREKLT